MCHYRVVIVYGRLHNPVIQIEFCARKIAGTLRRSTHARNHLFLHIGFQRTDCAADRRRLRQNV